MYKEGEKMKKSNIVYTKKKSFLFYFSREKKFFRERILQNFDK